MGSVRAGIILRHIRQLMAKQNTGELLDRELLRRFSEQHDEAAFETLMRRHGSMVLGVCRRILHSVHDAEDACQAAFLVLARKAGCLSWHDSVAPWLYQVAYRLARTAKAAAARRDARERQAPVRPQTDPLAEITGRELQAVLDEELARLPSKYQAPLVLCCLEGRTRDEAAQQLGCPLGTLKSRLERGRKLLRDRLARRGLELSAVLGAVTLAQAAAQAVLPAEMVHATLQAGLALAAGKSAAGAVSAQVVGLVNGGIKTMTLAKLKIAAALLLVVAVAGTGVLSHRTFAEKAAGWQPANRAQVPASVRTPLGGDHQEDPSDTLPEEKRSEILRQSGGENQAGYFQDITAGSGVDFTYRNGEDAGNYTILESLGGGVALLDYDGDGLLDIFVTGGGYFAGPDKKQIKGHPSKLYKNLGGWKFKDVTKEVGLDQPEFYSHGAAVADYDQDGWPDLLVTGWGRVVLYKNVPDGKGGRRFQDVTYEAGLVDRLWATSAAWADFDGDGYPDLYVCQYVDWSMDNNKVCGGYSSKISRDICPPKAFNALPHHLFRNNGNGTFTDVSKSAGLRPFTGDPDKDKECGKGLGVIIVDVDGDGKPDIWVANDTVDKFLYMNHSTPGKIRLEEVGLQSGVARDDRGVPNGSKGVDAADYNGRGRPSLWCTNYENEMHGLYRNQGPGLFLFSTPASGIAAIGQLYVGAGTGFLDLDNDGWEDLVIANGHVIRHPSGAPRRQRPVLLRNLGNGRFADCTLEGGLYFQSEHLGRGLAIGDLDNDGRPDLVISHLNEPVVLLRNVAKPRLHWLGIALAGAGRRDVVGAKVVVEVGDRQLTRFAKGGGSYLSSGDRRLLFGLDRADRIKQLTVTWPSGKQQHWSGDQLPIDRYWRLVEDKELPEALRRR